MKHLTYDERLQIQKAFTLNTSFAAIAQTLGKNRTTIASFARSKSAKEKPLELLKFQGYIGAP